MDTSSAVLETVRHALKSAGINEPDAKARVILSHAMNTGLGDVLLPLPVDSAQRAYIDAMAQRCAQGEPVEYVTGKAYFRYLELDVTPDVLIPRQETELVVEEAISLINALGYKRVLDIGTGSGCIAISLATETKACVDACDISPAALMAAAGNAHRNHADVRFFISDMLGGVTGTYDLIVSNPPYVSDEEYIALDAGVRDFEPKLALTAGDGLDYYRIIACEAGRFINPNGALVLEIGMTQAADVVAILVDNDFFDIGTKKDYSGRDRIVTAHKK